MTGAPPKEPATHPAELEMFRGLAYSREVDAMVPPTMIARRNLTTPRSPRNRPAVVPLPPGKS